MTKEKVVLNVLGIQIIVKLMILQTMRRKVMMKMKVKRRKKNLLRSHLKKKTKKTHFHYIKTYLPCYNLVSPVKFFFKTDRVSKWRMTI